MAIWSRVAGATHWMRLRWRRMAVATALLVLFGLGFYLTQLYTRISAMLDQRHGALTSAIYAAPLVIKPGDDIAELHLIQRLTRLSYAQVSSVRSPGEFARSTNTLVVGLRGFKAAGRYYAPATVTIALSGTRVAGLSDALGITLGHATLEPEIIGRLMPGAPAQRVEVSLPSVPDYVKRGLLATEDRYFYYHFAIDPVRIVEAAIADLWAHRLAQGASTITQQLARTFMGEHQRSFARKLRELAVALVLEMRLSKDQILDRYINDVPMGSYDGTPVFGLPMAARCIFNKDLSELTPAQGAVLIGMIQAPTLYNPSRHPRASLARRNLVLALMRRARVIDKATYVAAEASPLTIAKPVKLRRAPYFTDYVTDRIKHLLPGIGDELGGVKVYTTLDPEVQEQARAAVDDDLQRLEHTYRRLRRQPPGHRIQGALVALDADSGAILAMVGGRNYAASQFNRATQAQRQPGSSFKPIVYLAALDPSRSPLADPVTLASLLPDRPMSFGGWTPTNYEHNFRGSVTVVDSLADSLNVPTAYLGSLLGPATIVRTAHELGIHENLPPFLPISIGADDTTLLEMVSAYEAFASEGVEAPPYAITAIVDRNGKLLYRHVDQAKRVMTPSVAYLVTGALENVLRYGTGASAARLGLDFPAAGKTGTSDDYHDAWFIGYTPKVVAGVWVGFDRPRSIGLTGAEAALPAWVQFMVHTQDGTPEDFALPSGVVTETIDPQTGGLATPESARRVSLPFLIGTAPTQPCCSPGGESPPVFAGLAPSSPASLAGGAGSSASASANAGMHNSPHRTLGAFGKFVRALVGN